MPRVINALNNQIIGRNNCLLIKMKELKKYLKIFEQWDHLSQASKELVDKCTSMMEDYHRRTIRNRRASVLSSDEEWTLMSWTGEGDHQSTMKTSPLEICDGCG